MKKIVVLLLIIFNLVICQTFTDISAGLTGVDFSSAEWGDYDNDGDLDILLTGEFKTSGRITKIYKNDNGSFIDINANIQSIQSGCARWGDYDNDGDLDILIIGSHYDGSWIYFSKIYRNDAGIFTDIEADLPDRYVGCGAWGDYDNDGDLDILLTGYHEGIKHSQIFKNDNGIFSDANAELIGAYESSVAWGDYDNDGDLDILLTGNGTPGRISKIYRNDNGVFTDINAGLTGVSDGSTDWGDYDNDGDLDILLTGNSGTSRVSIIYQNNSGVFTDISANLTGVWDSTADWGDFDNDGDLDILLAGYTESSTRISKIYRNDSGSFTDIYAGLPGVNLCSASWGDYDNDGDLDFLLTGMTSSPERIAKIYNNNIMTSNSIPTAPSNLSSNVNNNDVTLSWDKTMDNETPQDGLSYNLYLRIMNASGFYKGPESDVVNGYRKVVSKGNVGQVDSYTIKNLQEGCRYFWSMQAIDNAYAGSNFSEEQSFIVGIITDSLTNPLAVTATDILSRSFTASWNTVPDANGYYLDVALDSNFTEFAPNYQNFNVDNFPAINISNLNSNTEYYYRVRAYNHAWTSGNSNIISVTTDPLSTPVADSPYFIRETWFRAKWFSSDALGYKIDVARDILFTDYVAGYQNKDVGNTLYHDITDLATDKTYFYRIRAYDSIGTTSENSNIISVTTDPLSTPVA
ncbi:VCBS repeat-containing protein, partial [bacterium]|nr:VCBS repeat-containing protein [bacterium]